MKAEDLKLEELVTFDNGALNFRGRRVVLHDAHAFGLLRRDLIEMVGLASARRLLTRFGFAWGQADAGAMKRVFRWESLEELLRAGTVLYSLQGATRSAVRSIRLDDGATFHMEIDWFNSGETEEHLQSIGATDHPVCWIQCGYASGYASFCLDREVFFIEKACKAKGDSVCRVVGRDRESWGSAIDDTLQYFETEDIQAKIADLTEKLRQKTLEVERQQRRFQEFGTLIPPGIAEVRSASFRKILDLASRAARFDSSILITGESGVGKEVLARYIHDNSPRSKGEFVTINCGALPESLLESELFGHKSGSFTGAIRDRKGLFEQANGGTIFLDEIGEISPALQVNLLRVLQEREVRRIGENVQRRIDVRIIAASNRNLDQEIKSGTFRDDLYYRLRVVEIRIPPLRDRPEDILPVARFIVKKLAAKLSLPRLRFDADCIEYLQHYPWPGNIRELENALERAAVLSEDGRISKTGLPSCVIDGEVPGQTPTYAPELSLKQVEAAHIQRVLRLTGGNRSEAAKTLRIGVTTLWRRLKDLETSTLKRRIGD
jgi:DNA-binding NtrC family response regulator/predicted hydrocarbon binding protein